MTKQILSAADLELADAEITKRATGTTVPCHWVHGAGEVDDEGTNFCLACCTAAAARHEGLTVDGGWSTEHDSVPTCEACGTHLDGSLTEYGAEQERDHYKAHGLHGDDWAAVALAFAAAEGEVEQEIAAMVMAHVRMEREHGPLCEGLGQDRSDEDPRPGLLGDDLWFPYDEADEEAMHAVCVARYPGTEGA